MSARIKYGKNIEFYSASIEFVWKCQHCKHFELIEHIDKCVSILVVPAAWNISSQNISYFGKNQYFVRDISYFDH